MLINLPGKEIFSVHNGIFKKVIDEMEKNSFISHF